MLIFGIFLGALVISTWVSWSKIREVNYYQTGLEVDDILDTASEKINTAWLEGHGFTTNLTLPEKLAGFNYTLNISGNYLVLTLETTQYLKPTVTENITGALIPGKTNAISNLGDHIEISQS